MKLEDEAELKAAVDEAREALAKALARLDEFYSIYG